MGAYINPWLRTIAQHANQVFQWNIRAYSHKIVKSGKKKDKKLIWKNFWLKMSGKLSWNLKHIKTQLLLFYKLPLCFPPEIHG